MERELDYVGFGIGSHSVLVVPLTRQLILGGSNKQTCSNVHVTKLTNIEVWCCLKNTHQDGGLGVVDTAGMS